MNKIDLRTCVAGQKVRTKGGMVGTYVGNTSPTSSCPHEFCFSGCPISVMYRDDGRYDNWFGSNGDIVEILPIEVVDNLAEIKRTV